MPAHSRREALDYRIESLADLRDLIPVVARWHWDEWGHADPKGSLETWTAGLRRTRRNAIPTAWVALLDEEPVGSVTIVQHDMEIHTELSPWLAGLYVVPTQRGRGAGTALVSACERGAVAMGVTCLYLHTAVPGFYERLGWTVFGREFYEGEAVTLMSKEVSPELGDRPR